MCRNIDIPSETICLSAFLFSGFAVILLVLAVIVVAVMVVVYLLFVGSYGFLSSLLDLGCCACLFMAVVVCDLLRSLLFSDIPLGFCSSWSIVPSLLLMLLFLGLSLFCCLCCYLVYLLHFLALQSGSCLYLIVLIFAQSLFKGDSTEARFLCTTMKKRRRT